MAPAQVSGTEGYAEEADELVQRYEAISFTENHRSILHLIPPPPCHVLDIGAGTGRDAAGFAALGHSVVAVEPTGELRTRAMRLHPSPLIEWVDDSLPELNLLMGRGDRFDAIMLTAVWMHLDEPQRRRAMPRVAALLACPGVMIMSLRHGPVPPGRRMFEVSAQETVLLAREAGLRVLVDRSGRPDRLGRDGVSWTRLAFATP